DKEAAALIRRSPAAVQRMRLDGGLPYIPGRPPLIAESDLFAHLEGMKCRSRNQIKAESEVSPTQSRPTTDSGMSITPSDDAASARAWVLKRKSRPSRASRSGSC